LAQSGLKISTTLPERLNRTFPAISGTIGPENASLQQRKRKSTKTNRLLHLFL
jgi:hypothetical protein